MTSYLRRWSSQAIYLAINWPYLADPTAVYVNMDKFHITDYLKNKKIYENWLEDPAYVAATNNPGPNLEEPQRVEETRETQETEETDNVPHNYEELIQTQDFLERRNIIEVHGYRHFVQWFEDWRFFTHCQLYGVNAPLHLLNPTRPRQP